MRLKSSIPSALALTLAMSAVLSATARPVRAEPLISASTELALGVIFVPTVWAAGITYAEVLTLGAGIAATAGATTAVSSVDVEKQALAQSTLEDAAHFYDSGRLTGMLPAAIARMRELNPELKSSSDAQLVDSLVEAAQLVAPQRSSS